jgi:hypothetical protein
MKALTKREYHYVTSYKFFKSIGIDIFKLFGITIPRDEDERVKSILKQHMPEMLLLTGYNTLCEIVNRPFERWRSMPEENFVMSRSKLIDRLSDMYHTDCLAVADCCDKVLDRSGALLGEVRERHSKIYGAVDNFVQQPQVDITADDDLNDSIHCRP